MRQINCDDLQYDSGQSNVITIDKFPDKCPLCNIHIRPEDIGAFQTGEDRVEAVFQCTNEECSKLFLGYYSVYRVNTGRNINYTWYLQYCLPQKHEKVSQPEEINDISPEFENIYNQAKLAEDSGLFHVSGMGYRKSLEFLIIC